MLSKKVRHVKNCHLHTCHLHNDTTERGTSKQPDKAPVTKERRCGRSLTQETLGIIRGGGGSRALDPPTQTPPPLQLNSYKRSLFGTGASSPLYASPQLGRGRSPRPPPLP